MECDCNSQCTGAVVAAILEPVVMGLIIVTVIGIVVGITRWRKHSSSCGVGVTQEEQGMDDVVQLANPNVDPPTHLPVEAPQSANNVPPTGEGQIQPLAQPAQGGQERNRNQNLDPIQSFVEVYQHANSCVILPIDPIRPPVEGQSVNAVPCTGGTLKPRRGSHSSRDDPDVRRGSVPAPLSPLVHGFSASPQSPRSPNKKRRFSISSLSSKRQSQIEDGEKTNLLSPVDDEHLTLGDGHTSDDP